MGDKWNREDALAVRGIINRIDMCGCGTDGHMEVLLLLLERAEDHEKKGSFYDKAEDASARWVEFGAKVIDSWNLTTHGVGIGWAWLEDDGKLLLRFLRDFGITGWHMDDEEGWPLWSVEFSWNEKPEANDTFAEWETRPPALPGGRRKR